MTRGVTRRAVLGGQAVAGGVGIAGAYVMSSEFGFGPPMPRSLRRSVRDVLVTS
jgi:hypothetical protein